MTVYLNFFFFYFLNKKASVNIVFFFFPRVDEERKLKEHALEEIITR